MNALWSLVISILGLVKAQDGGILFPEKEGYDIGIVLISETCFSWNQYELLGRSMQQQSDFRIWIYLSDNYMDPSGESCSSETISDPCDISEVPSFIQTGRDALVNAGFPEQAPLFASGHGCGGSMALEELRAEPELADGAILVGASMDEGGHTETPNPVMVVNGDLDGMMRFASVALMFRDQYTDIESGKKTSVYSHPHVMLEGVNHVQFVTGEVPDYVNKFHIVPEVENGDSRQLISQAVASFLEFQINNTTRSREQLEDYYEVMRVGVQPVYMAFDLECNYSCTKCPWAIVGQDIVADINDTLVLFEIDNTLFDEDVFGSTYPSVQNMGDNIIFLNTTASLSSTNDTEYLYEASFMISTKFKNRQAILEAISGEDEEFRLTKFCQDVNKAAWKLIWDEVIPAKQQSRFINRNVTVTFLVDDEKTTGSAWLDSVLLFEFNGDDLTIQSTTLTSRTNPENDRYFGMQYCKLASPARLLEFIYTDALYENYYWCVYHYI